MDFQNQCDKRVDTGFPLDFHQAMLKSKPTLEIPYRVQINSFSYLHHLPISFMLRRYAYHTTTDTMCANGKGNEQAKILLSLCLSVFLSEKRQNNIQISHIALAVIWPGTWFGAHAPCWWLSDYIVWEKIESVKWFRWMLVSVVLFCIVIIYCSHWSTYHKWVLCKRTYAFIRAIFGNFKTSCHLL